MPSFRGKTERRLSFVVLMTAMVPLAIAVLLANSLFRQASSLWFNPEVGQQLDRGINIYKDYVRVLKDGMRTEAALLASNEGLRAAAARHDIPALTPLLEAEFRQFPSLVSLAVEDADGNAIAQHDRGTPVDARKERSLEVRRPLTSGTRPTVLAAMFAIDRGPLDDLETAGTVAARYHQLEASRADFYQAHIRVFALLLGITMLGIGFLGAFLARGVTRRIYRLANAINLVAEGDLSVRVPVTGSDELTELARVFNRMLEEVEDSRTRIEYLQRIGAWQEMAQRLAHEIKNPLTPIQLAVQECHRKYEGEDVRFRALLDTTREIVEEEVGTLRRLVVTFSSFARMPHAELKMAPLVDFLRECSEQFAHLDEAVVPSDGSLTEPFSIQNIDVAWRFPESELPVRFDRQLLRSVLVNLLSNAAQAIRGISKDGSTERGKVSVTAYETAGSGAAIAVDDNGPGVDEAVYPRVFEPYFTTKTDGTGLGLAIVKKIVMEHGGRIKVERSPTLGGARFVIALPGPLGLDG